MSIGIAACGSDRTLSEEATSEEEVETAVSSEAEDYEATPALSDEQDIAAYDYRFYLQGIYLSSDGSDDKIYIKPEGSDEERILSLCEETQFRMAGQNDSVDPLYFFQWMREAYGQAFAVRPLCLSLNGDGTVEGVAEPEDVVPTEKPESSEAEISGEGQEALYTIDTYPWVDDYDYYFYLQGIYLSSDGSDDKIYIKPVEFVDYANEEHRKKYNIPENESGSYEIIESTDEVIALSLSEETEFHIINWHKSQELADHSLNHDLQGIVALDDPLYFFKWMSEDYGDWLAKYPLCLYLNEDGTVERVIELWLP